MVGAKIGVEQSFVSVKLTRGAEASASLYSLVITAKENSLETYHYLRFVFDKIPFANTEEDYRKLLPQNVDHKTIKLQSIG